MASLGEAVIEIGADTKPFKKDVEQGVDNTLKKSGDKGGKSFAKKALGSISSIMTKGVKLTGVAAAGALGTALFKGFNRLKDIEQAQAKLAGLGHSAKSVDKIMSNALDSVKGTAFGLGDAASVAASTVAAGVKPGKDLTRTLKLVGDAATIAGVGMGDMGSIFNKVAASGKIQGDVIAQLGDKGIPILQLLGKELGKTPQEVAKLASQGKVGFADFQNAMEKGLGGAALKAGGTFQGALDNMGAALGRLGAALLSGVYPMAKQAFNGITVFLDNLTAAAGPVIESLSNKLPGAISAVTTAVSGLVSGGGGKLQPFIDSIKGFAGSLVDAGATAGPALATIASGLAPIVQMAAGGIIAGLTVAFNVLGPAVEGAATAFAAMVGFVQSNQTTFTVIAGIITGVVTPAIVALGIKSLQSSTKQVTAWLTTQSAAVKSAATQVAAAWRVIGSWVAAGARAVATGARVAASYAVQSASAVKNAAVQMASAAKTVAANAMISAGLVASKVAMIASTVAVKAMTAAQWLLNAAMTANPITLIILGLVALGAAFTLLWMKSETFRNIVTGAFNAIKNAAVAVFNWVKSNWPLLLAIITGPVGLAVLAVVKNWDRIKSVTQSVFNWVKSFISNVFNSVKSTVTNVLNAIKAIFSKVFGSIKKVVSSTLNGVKSAFSGGLGALRGIASSAMGSVRDAVSTGVGKVVSTIKGLPGKAVGALGGIGSSLISSGEKLIKGFITGIGNMAGAVKDKVKGVLKGARRLLPFSPAKEGPFSGKGWTLYSGRSLMVGFADGITSGGSKVTKSTQKVLDKLNTSLTKSVIKNSKVNYQSSKKSTTSLAKVFSGEFAELSKPMAKLNTQIDAAKSALNSAKQALVDYRNGLASSLSNTSDALFSGGSGAGIIASLTKQRDETKAWGEALKKLQTMKLDKTIFDQIAQKGPSALATAQALIDGGASTITQVNALQGQINTYAKNAGNTAATYMYAAGISSAKGVLAGLKKEEKALKAVFDKMGLQLANSFKKHAGSYVTKPRSAKKTAARKHANGTAGTLGGTFLAGERGPELISAPRGTRVYNAKETANLASVGAGGGGDTKIEVANNYYGPTTSRGRLKELEWTLKYATRARKGDGDE